MKKPIALLINDIHISKDNISEFNLNWDEMLSVCKKYNVSNVIVGGDMFTERSSQPLSVLLAVNSALIKADAESVDVLIAEGNHDLIDQEAYDGYNHLYSKHSNVAVIDIYYDFWLSDDLVLLVMSYFPENGSFLKLLEQATKEILNQYGINKKNIMLYIHEGVHGALGDFEIPTEIPQQPLLEYKAVLCGHYHNRTKIKGTNIEYIGASRQHNFGEDEEKGYTIIYSDGSYEFVKNEVNKRYKTFEITPNELSHYTLEADPRYKYKVKVKCSEAEAKLIDKQQIIGMGFDKVEIVTPNTDCKNAADTDITDKYDIVGIRQEYLNYCNENSIDSKLGMKYLK